MKKFFYVLVFLLFPGVAFAVSLTTNYVSKAAAGAQIKNSIIYDNDTNVGVGTATPTHKLEVSGNVAIGTTGNSSTTMITVTCDNGNNLYPCSTYTTTSAAKLGSIKINVNGVTRYINYYQDPN